MARSGLFHRTLMTLWPLSRLVYWLGNRRAFRPLSELFFRALKSEAIIVPVHETVAECDSVVLPYPMLAPLVSATNTRVLMNHCMCRRGEHCQTHPEDFGCLYLGEGAAKISSSMGRPVDEAEAIAHIERAMSLGLAPLIVHTPFDALALGIPYRRMLGICFCCDCCCTVRQGLRIGPPAFWDMVVRLPGLAVEIDGACSGCGACVDVCYVGAVSLTNGRARIDGGACKGCGRCLMVCPAAAIGLQMDENVDAMGELMGRITERTEIGLPRDGVPSESK